MISPSFRRLISETAPLPNPLPPSNRGTPLLAITIAWLFAALSWIPPLNAEESYQEKLTRGILAEESQHDFKSALAIYADIVHSADQQRGTIASALYRLAETQRRIGQTNEATQNYRRLINEYPESTNLVQLARQQIAGPTPTSSNPVADEELLLQQEIAIAEKVLERTRKMVTNGTSGQDSLWKAERDVLQLKRELAVFRGRHQLVDLAVPSTTSSPDSNAADDEDREISRLKKLFTNSPDLINASSPSGPTELTRAVGTNQPRVVEFLISIGADVNGVDERGWTPLARAATIGNKRIVDLLLKAGASPNATASAQFAPLHQAVGFGHRIIAETLIQGGASLDDVSGFSSQKQSFNSTPLGIAVMINRPPMAELLIGAGADPNHPLSNPTDISSRSLSDPQFPITWAAKWGHWQLIELLLDHGANPNPDGVSVLSYCAFAPPSIWEKLLAKGGKLDLESAVVPTPLNAAVENSRVEFVDWLLVHGADENWVDRKGQSVVVHAIEILRGPKRAEDIKSPLAVLERLLKAKPNLESKVSSKYPPLVVAVSSRVPEAVELLLRAGANPSPTLDRELSLTYTILQDNPINEEDRWRIFKALLEAGANPNERGSDDSLLLNVIGRDLDTRYVELLLKKGANPNTRTNQGQTLLDWLQTVYLNRKYGSAPDARQVERVRVIQNLLLAAGAREDFPDFETIKVARASTHFDEVIFRRFGDGDHNSFTLMELLAVSYGYLYPPQKMPRSDATAIAQPRILPNMLGSYKESAKALRFPAWDKVAIYRYTGEPGHEVKSVITVDVAALFSGTKTNDVRLQWGDVVEIPERDHALSDLQDGPTGLTEALDRFLPRTVLGRSNGGSFSIDLLQGTKNLKQASETPGGSRSPYPGNPTLAQVLQTPGLIRLSSDLTRVQFRRHANTETWDTILDCSVPGTGRDIWLQEGDEIEVPEKSK